MAAVALVALLVYARDACFLVFLAMLFAVLLYQLAMRIPGSFPYSLKLGLVGCLMLGAVVCLFVLFGIKIENGVAETAKLAEKGTTSLRNVLDDHDLLRPLLRYMPFDSVEEMGEAIRQEMQDQRSNGGGRSPIGGQTAGAALSRAVDGILSASRTTFGLLINTMFVLVVGAFLAVDPATYRRGAVRMFPPKYRERADSVMGEMGTAMWAWMIGQFLQMLITGVGTGLAMWLLGVPLAWMLGLLTGILSFIPNVGPAMALIVATLIGLSQGLSTAGLVIVTFLGFQFLESYVTLPLIQSHQVHLPPALLISTQLFFAIFGGFLGLLVATPLLAVSMVLVRRVYLEGMLERDAAPS